jgi:hypothetical protein
LLFFVSFSSMGKSSDGSNPWCILLCIAWIFVFPIFKQNKMAFPHHTMLVIEDLATGGLVGGWHNMPSCKRGGSYTHKARHVQSVFFRRQWRRLLGHFIVLRLYAVMLPRSHTLIEARIPGKTRGKDHEKAAQLSA